MTFLKGGKRSNEKPSSKDAACISRQSQPEPSNQMSQTFSQIAKPTVRNALTTYTGRTNPKHSQERAEDGCNRPRLSPHYSPFLRISGRLLFLHPQTI